MNTVCLDKNYSTTRLVTKERPVIIKKEEVKKIHKLTEVKSMLTQIAQQIEERGIQQGMHKGLQTVWKYEKMLLRY